ncbi:hypothetical protein ABKN59_009788 [Abortiporus biennis]
MSSERLHLPLSPIPPVRRVVTGHSRAGEATFIRDEAPHPMNGTDPGQEYTSYTIHATNSVPANNDGELANHCQWIDESSQVTELVNKNGAILRAYDTAPGARTVLHRTLSLDYGIVAKGSITLYLENNEKRTLNEGDVVIQRGTIHSWKNETDEWCRVYFAVIDAHPIEVHGKKLEEVFHS